MNKWLILMVLIVNCSVLMLGCNNDDLSPYTNIDYEVSIHLESNIFVISEAREELSLIVGEYEKDMPLTYAEYEINNTKRTAAFEFFRPYSNGENRAICITLYIDIDTNTVTKINYQDGHGKRLASVKSTEIEQTADVNIMDIYNEEIDGKTLESNQFVNISVADAEIVTNIVEYTDSGQKKIITLEDTSTLMDDDFIVKNGDFLIKLGEKIENVNLGDNLVSHYPNNNDGDHDTYIYENLTLWVAPNTKNESNICFISLVNPVFETFRGIKVGDSISKVFDEYGVPQNKKYSVSQSNYSNFYTYNYDGKIIMFFVDREGKIVQINLEEI